MTCTTCEAPSELYLCGACLRDLDARLAQGRKILPELDATVARLDVVRSAGNEGANGTRTQGSAAPINIDAWQVREDLLLDLSINAGHYAKDPWSAEESQRVIANIKRAELLVSGPEPDAPTKGELMKAAADIRHNIPEELLVPDLIVWLQNVHQIEVKAPRIWKWAERGHITRTNTEGRAKYSPAAVLIHARKDRLQQLNKTRKV